MKEIKWEEVKKNHQKQPTIGMQQIAILSSLKGHFSNFKDGRMNITFLQFEAIFEKHINELMDTAELLRGAHKWTDSGIR